MYLYQLRRTPESHHENVYAPVYPPHKWFFKEAGEPGSLCLPVFHLLQLRKDSPDPESDPGDGGGSFRSCLEFGGNCRVGGLIILCEYQLRNL